MYEFAHRCHLGSKPVMAPVDIFRFHLLFYLTNSYKKQSI